MKQFRVVITDTTTGEQSIHEVEGFTFLAVQSEIEGGFEAAVETRQLNGKHLHALIAALKDEHPELKAMELLDILEEMGGDCDCDDCQAEREASKGDASS